MKFIWKQRLFIGVVFFISHYLVTILFNFFLTRKQSSSEMFFISLITSVFMAFFIPIMMKRNSNKLSKNIDAILPNIISGNEKIYFQDMANQRIKKGKVIGKLFLTNERLLFISHKLNVKSGVTSINPMDITSIERVKIMRFFDNGLKIELKNNHSYTFVVNERETWVEKLYSYSKAA